MCVCMCVCVCVYLTTRCLFLLSFPRLFDFSIDLSTANGLSFSSQLMPQDPPKRMERAILWGNDQEVIQCGLSAIAQWTMLDCAA